MRRLIALLMALSIGCAAQETKEQADIVSVEVTGVDKNYTFAVGISSPDTGCEQYANWWEVVSKEGQLLYRRILGHSHVTEQPFVRSGGKVNISGQQEIIIRAHMNTSGYGGIQLRGSVKAGFEKISGNNDFALHLEKKLPLPTNCAF